MPKFLKIAIHELSNSKQQEREALNVVERLEKFKNRYKAKQWLKRQKYDVVRLVVMAQIFVDDVIIEYLINKEE